MQYTTNECHEVTQGVLISNSAFSLYVNLNELCYKIYQL